MTPDTHRYFELLEQRIALLGSLAGALTAARLDLVSFDIAGLEDRITQQDRLCTQIRAVDAELDRVQQHGASILAISAASTATPAPDSHRLRELLERLNSVQSHVKHLNDSHQMLLRRSRRTANALLNSYLSFAETYSAPAATPAAAAAREGA